MHLPCGSQVAVFRSVVQMDSVTEMMKGVLRGLRSFGSSPGNAVIEERMSLREAAHDVHGAGAGGVQGGVSRTGDLSGPQLRARSAAHFAWPSRHPAQTHPAGDRCFWSRFLALIGGVGADPAVHAASLRVPVALHSARASLRMWVIP